jgi:methanogenic corrinoid protein MtbC1
VIRYLQVETIVWSAPVTERFAWEIGADRYAPDAASAVDLVKSPLAKLVPSLIRNIWFSEK